MTYQPSIVAKKEQRKNMKRFRRFVKAMVRDQKLQIKFRPGTLDTLQEAVKASFSNTFASTSLETST